jgi:hypothetical protein
VTGRAVTDVLPEAEDLLEPASPANVKDRKREVKRGDRTYEMTTTSLSGRAGPGPEGRVIMLYDITARRQALERQAQLAAEARARARTLRGLLPICSACKRIRDDGGYWQEVEEYVREHSEAEFSHGMCPECAREYYGEALADEDPGSGSNPQD